MTSFDVINRSRYSGEKACLGLPAHDEPIARRRACRKACRLIGDLFYDLEMRSNYGAGMTASYKIEVRPIEALLKVTLTGFFACSDVKRLKTDLLTAIDSLHCQRGTHFALYDIRECKIQSQEIVHALRTMSDAKGIVARRLAVVAGNSLMRMQLARILVDREAMWFDDLPQALLWLRSARALHPNSGASAAASHL